MGKISTNEILTYWRACQELREAIERASPDDARGAVAELEAIVLHTDLASLRRAAIRKVMETRYVAYAPAKNRARRAVSWAARKRQLEPGEIAAPPPLGSVVNLVDARVKRLGHPPGTVRRAKLGRRGHGKQISTPPEL